MNPLDFTKLKDFSKTINEESDELVGAISAINHKLSALNLGIEVFLSSDFDDYLERTPYQCEDAGDEETHNFAWLGFGKYLDKWCLLVRTGVEHRQSDQDGNTVYKQNCIDDKPLLEASRELRIAAVERFPKLISALETEAERLHNAVKTAKAIAEDL